MKREKNKRSFWTRIADFFGECFAFLWDNVYLLFQEALDFLFWRR